MRKALSAFLLATTVLLSGCDTGTSPTGNPTAADGPPTTSASPVGNDSELAARYRRAGGDPDVYGIKHAKNRDGVLVLTVWSRKRSGYGGGFDDFDRTLTSFLTGTGVSLDQGYVLNVYGPDGAILHRYDTTVENNS
ncbi:hypothetical protein PZB75_13485 [Streptomyces sp. AM 4-1-1]|uniref:hypothetical protein n=1 Tax=Streptomyces sp. AM 4-1-1 TaxID=3028710 RepID=UPI0023B95193|nr:hypothetical protein [Streptomyces sp. AM 4-1-1]WEH34284.1 hypothetical protein PZB75_13485 [Streptomyces sp. AM 4-1-1]